MLRECIAMYMLMQVIYSNREMGCHAITDRETARQREAHATSEAGSLCAIL